MGLARPFRETAFPQLSLLPLLFLLAIATQPLAAATTKATHAAGDPVQPSVAVARDAKEEIGGETGSGMRGWLRRLELAVCLLVEGIWVVG